MESWISKWLRTGVATTITVVWSVSMITDAFSEKYEVHFAVHGLMMAVATAVLGVSITKKGNGTS